MFASFRPETEGSYPLSPVHIPDEEFEANANQNEENPENDSDSLGLPSDHQPGVLGLDEQMPS